MVKVLVNLLMNEETQQQMDSFLLRNTSVDLAAITEQFLVKFMLHYEMQVELERMSREGADLEIVEASPVEDRAGVLLHTPPVFDLGQAVTNQEVIIDPERHLIQASHDWHLTPIDPEELQTLQRQGLASPLLPRAGASTSLFSNGPAVVDGSRGQKGRKKASVQNAEADTTPDH